MQYACGNVPARKLIFVCMYYVCMSIYSIYYEASVSFETYLCVNVCVLTMTNHVCALLQVSLHRLRGRAQVGRHTRLQDSEKRIKY